MTTETTTTPRTAVTSAAFKRAVTACQAITPNKSRLPVLGTIQVRALNGRVAFDATDLDTFTSVYVDGQTEEPGTMLLPARETKKIVTVIPGDMVSIVGPGRATTRIESGPFGSDLNAFDPSEYPALPDVDAMDAVVSVPAEPLLDIRARVLGFESTEESRPILNGIFFHEHEGFLYVVATNGHVMALYPTTVVVPKGFGVNVTRDVVNHFGRVFSKGETVELRVATDGPHVAFVSEGAVAGGRCIQGTYPNVRRVIPRDDDLPLTMTVDAGELDTALRTLLPLASDQTHRIVFDVSDPDHLTLSAHTPDTGSSEYRIAADIAGLPKGHAGYFDRIAFNGEYIRKRILSGLSPKGLVTVRMKAPERATVWTHPATDMVAVLMPLRPLD